MDNGRFGLRVGTEPNCYEGDCFGLIFFVSPPTASWPPQGDMFTAVDLGNGIQGYVSEPTYQGTVIDFMVSTKCLVENFERI